MAHVSHTEDVTSSVSRSQCDRRARRRLRPARKKLRRLGDCLRLTLDGQRPFEAPKARLMRQTGLCAHDGAADLREGPWYLREGPWYRLALAAVSGVAIVDPKSIDTTGESRESFARMVAGQACVRVRRVDSDDQADGVARGRPRRTRRRRRPNRRGA